MDGRLVSKENALGALMGTNVAPTADAPMTINIAMAQADAAAIYSSITTKMTVMRGSTSQQ